MLPTIKKIIVPLLVLCPILLSPAAGAEKVITDDLNLYFSDLDESFARIVDAGALRSTSLKSAERLFVREMRKNRAFNTFIRTNSKGAVISEVIRGEKVERPMRDISDQAWFRSVTKNLEPYYSLIKDEDRGRFYLFWARPILKQGNRCVGTVLLKIDLWDSFYEFSNDIYYPFLIKLGRKSLFSHKWKDAPGAKEEQLTVQGIDRITVTYIPEKKAPEPVVAAPTVDSSAPAAAFSVGDTGKLFDKKAEKKKGKSGVLIFFVVILVIAIAGASAMLIAWMRRRALMRRIDDDDII